MPNGHILLRGKLHPVEFSAVDFYTPEAIERQAKFFADADEAERRGGCFFAQMGALEAGRHAEQQSLLTPTRE